MKTVGKLCAIVILTGAIMTGGWYMCVGLDATFGWWSGTKAMANVTSDQGTDMEPSTNVENKPDMAVVAMRAIQRTQEATLRYIDSLTSRLNTTEANETYWFQMWVEARAEIEQLQKPTKSMCDPDHLRFAFGGLVCDNGFTCVN